MGNSKQSAIEEKLALKAKKNEWQEIRVHGDILEISKSLNISENHAGNLVNHGSGSLKLLRQVNEYFERRKAFLNNQNK